jgi:hypothetical protein
MKLKFKLAAFASAIGLAASMGITFAGPAAAEDEVNMWVEPFGSGGSGYVFVDGGLPAGVQVLMSVNAPSSLFNAPTAGGTYAQISYYGDGGSGSSSRCLEIDSGLKVGSSDGIVLEPCDGKASEEWRPVKGTNTRGATYYEYVSEYGSNLCLNADPYSDPQAPNAATCNGGSNTNEQWILTQY